MVDTESGNGKSYSTQVEPWLVMHDWHIEPALIKLRLAVVVSVLSGSLFRSPSSIQRHADSDGGALGMA